MALGRTVTDSDYDAIECAIMESARGRWFLSEYARRNRQAEAKLLLSEICSSLVDRIEAVMHQPSSVADMRCKNQQENSDLHDSWWRVSDEFVSRY